MRGLGRRIFNVSNAVARVATTFVGGEFRGARFAFAGEVSNSSAQFARLEQFNGN